MGKKSGAEAVCIIIVIIIVIIIIIAVARYRRDGEFDRWESREWDDLWDDDSRSRRHDHSSRRHDRSSRRREESSGSSDNFRESRRISSRIHFLDESKSDCSPAIHKIRDTVRFRRHESRPCSDSSSSSDSSCSRSSSSESSHCGCTKCRRGSSSSSSSASWHHARSH
jgi:FtsZ-interacting cell division protein ZipA